MRVLVTNDDGVDAPGIAALARALDEAGFDVLVAAPATEASGAGAGVGPLHTMSDGIEVTAVEPEGLEGIETLAVEALPALIVIAGCLGAYGAPPDLVVAGINPGRNVGRAVLHSGTIGAALTAVHFNKRGLAMSIQSGPFSAYETDTGDRIHFETAAALAAELAPRVAAAPPRTVVSCNVPNLPLDQLRGIRLAKLARSGLIRSALVDATGSSRMQLELGFGDAPAGEESDEALTAGGYATLTPLASVAEETRPDVRSAVAAAMEQTESSLGIPTGTASQANGPAA
ncbi:MAG TPA: 5'/3'-nucleotidase SurE [Acidimicrobiales bacterium]|nr:5'/3'-nucleotidase SurE [Acidimicrobiales bacterium]